VSAVVIPLRRPAPATPAEPSYLREAFGPGGWLAKAAGGSYEVREGQLQLAAAVDQAFARRVPAFLEGPCGTGKSFAYLIPGIVHALGRRQASGRAAPLLVSTASIALQEQLVATDLPRLQQALPQRFTFALLKGRANFLCNDAVGAATVPYRATAEETEQLRQIKRWAEHTPTGDKSELPFVPVERLWKRVTVDGDDCKGKDCPQRDACHFERARQAAAGADVLVVNHHLLCADLAVRAAYPGVSILPEAAALVVDEAHELADVARDFFGATLTPHVVKRLARYAEEFDAADPADVTAAGEAYFADLRALAEAHERAELGEHRRSIYSVKRPLDDGREVAGAAAFADHVARLARGAAQELKELDEAEKERGLSDAERDARAKHRTASRRFGKVARWLERLHGEPDPNVAAWLELQPPDDRGERRFALEARQVDVTPALQSLAERVKALVLTSATLTVAGSFEHLQGETGIAPAIALEVASPFDFRARCLVVTPDRMPLPDAPDWPAACAQVIKKLVAAADGRTLALFSSKKNLERVFALVATTSDRAWLKQGALPSRQLASAFKRDPRAVLFGLKSFWTGIDVPGDSCVAVFVDRIPFPQREDPIIRKLHAQHGTAAFERVDLPRALMQLRQGFGRLIRARSDYGVVVFGDRRVVTKGWGRRVWQSLPACARGRSSAEVGAFLARFRQQPEGGAP